MRFRSKLYENMFAPQENFAFQLFCTVHSGQESVFANAA